MAACSAPRRLLARRLSSTRAAGAAEIGSSSPAAAAALDAELAASPAVVAAHRSAVERLERGMSADKLAAAKRNSARVHKMFTGIVGKECDPVWERELKTGRWSSTPEGRERRRSEQNRNIQSFDAITVAFVSLVVATCGLIYVVAPLIPQAPPRDSDEQSSAKQYGRTVQVTGTTGDKAWELLNVTKRRPASASASGDGTSAMA